MTPIDVRVWVVFAFIIPILSCQWFQPTAKRELWHVGDVHNIQYHTDLTAYTITLWQQAIAGGSATPGPIIFQAKTGPAKALGWTVQLYDFDLESSNIFFFWLKEGGPENATGPVTGRTMSSSYFNITDEPSPTTTSSSSSSSSTNPSRSTDLGAALSSTSSTATQTGPDQGEATASSRIPGEGIGGTDGVSEGGGGGEGGGLPVAAQAGIGVGVSVVGVVVIICGILWFRYLKKQQQILLDLQRRAHPEPPPPDAAGTGTWKPQVPPPPPVQYYPVYEMGYHSRTPPVELGCHPPNLR
ncbi:predicted protein [Chaetomium globosum CBS 148.51]|uniref:Mid2 domain-containing protein n=1 Tax=Chaetomium globosum (strain ATCC 6205 / CBS 148.51 / DSM 1962 / NBRC 6347 / NRRL 1970) TaxID=306901 RepID=Q2H506_CHAGB|nr:uncharacterized protein CHGG_06259 [Chaetomium globosum CBS 148.51]EAQ89640.1 predicted protein [Chaetomium globosum CBS 148.51]